MARASVQVIGAKELRKALREAGDEGLKVELKTANRNAADVVVKRALPKVPVRSGRLKASVRATASQVKANVNAGTARVDYASAIHWGRKTGSVWHHQTGTNVIKGRPFLTEALDGSVPEIQRQYETAMDALCKRVSN